VNFKRIRREMEAQEVVEEEEAKEAEKFEDNFYLFKNPASLGLAKIKNTVYLLYMKENGA